LSSGAAPDRTTRAPDLLLAVVLIVILLITGDVEAAVNAVAVLVGLVR